LGQRILFGAALLVILGVWPVIFQRLTQAEPDVPSRNVSMFAHPAFAATSAGGGTIADIAENAVDSVVNIATSRGQGGSGVIVSDDGIVITNNHVVAGARRISVTTAKGKEFKAKLIGADRDSDLAVLRLQGKVSGLSAMAIGDSSALRLGEIVLAIGNPLGVGQTVTMGIVSAKDRAGYVQTDAAINPGNSGGALVNMRGELVGINTLIMSRTGGSDGLGFAIPSNTAEPILKALLKDGQGAWLGVSIVTVTPQLASQYDLSTDTGVYISGVVRGSPADAAGIEPHDVVVKVGRKTVTSAAELQKAVKAAGVGNSLDVQLYRGDKKKKLRIELVARADGNSANMRTQPNSSGDDSLGGLSIAKLDSSMRRAYGISRRVRSGVVITGVNAGSEAEAAGLQQGDVIVEVNRNKIKSTRAFARAHRKNRSRLLLLINRDGDHHYIVLQR
jgi:serine protease Do